MTTSRSRTFYDVLNLNRDASKADVKDAYKKMALRCHPDKNLGDSAANAMFQEIVLAYETLYDNSKRMQYNLTIGVNVQGPSYSQVPHYHGATSNSHQRPQSPIYNSFWSQAPRPKPPSQQPEWTTPEEDWSKSYVPPTEDFWDKWTREQEEEKKANDERKAKKHEKRRERMLAELPQRLAEELATIVQLDSLVEKASSEQIAAVDIAENMIAEKQSGPFWEVVFEANVKVNSLRRERDNCVNSYKKLYRDLKKLDRKKSEEARETYRALRQRVLEKKDKLFPDPEDSDELHEPIRTSQEESPQGKDEYLERSIPRRQDPENDDADPKDHPEHEDESDSAQANRGVERSGSEADKDEDDHGYEEFILYKTRIVHESHKEVQAEFWNIADEDELCCYCGNICVVMQCPRFEECGLYACEFCKSSH